MSHYDRIPYFKKNLPENIVASGLVAKLLARLLQGVNLTDAIADIEDHLETLQDMDENETITLSHPFTTLQLLKECIEVYVKSGFEPAILRIIFKGEKHKVILILFVVTWSDSLELHFSSKPSPIFLTIYNLAILYLSIYILLSSLEHTNRCTLLIQFTLPTLSLKMELSIY